jgi:hypothetical protein
MYVLQPDCIKWLDFTNVRSISRMTLRDVLYDMNTIGDWRAMWKKDSDLGKYTIRNMQARQPM